MPIFIQVKIDYEFKILILGLKKTILIYYKNQIFSFLSYVTSKKNPSTYKVFHNFINRRIIKII